MAATTSKMKRNMPRTLLHDDDEDKGVDRHAWINCLKLILVEWHIPIVLFLGVDNKVSSVFISTFWYVSEIAWILIFIACILHLFGAYLIHRRNDDAVETQLRHLITLSAVFDIIALIVTTLVRADGIIK